MEPHLPVLRAYIADMRMCLEQDLHSRVIHRQTNNTQMYGRGDEGGVHVHTTQDAGGYAMGVDDADVFAKSGFSGCQAVGISCLETVGMSRIRLSACCSVDWQRRLVPGQRVWRDI
jgi:hypothetical protein